MVIYGSTDKGQVRENNQDTFRLGRLSNTAVYAVVCDGLGGANGGNVASEIAADMVESRIVSQYRENMPEASVLNMLESAVDAANVQVYDKALSDPELLGMGTTLVLAIVDQTAAYVVHVGDSRLYHLTENAFTQITTDHSVVQEMIEKGQLTEEEAKEHPRKHFITRAVGVEMHVRPDFDVLTVSAGDKLLLCTDGLSNMLDGETLERLLRTEDETILPQTLIELANQAGGNDNITAVVIA